ncbi:MAG: histidinol dehydrogenase, partial [Ruminococcaceae bacterium]|nr:histidinol dehydrogenase [Oscillospiraceae bacterium]
KARFFSPLHTADFQKKISLIDYSRSALESCWEKISLFAEAEQLTCHAESVRVRFGKALADAGQRSSKEAQ